MQAFFTCLLTYFICGRTAARATAASRRCIYNKLFIKTSMTVISMGAVVFWCCIYNTLFKNHPGQVYMDICTAASRRCVYNTLFENHPGQVYMYICTSASRRRCIYNNSLIRPSRPGTYIHLYSGITALHLQYFINKTI